MSGAGYHDVGIPFNLLCLFNLEELSYVVQDDYLAFFPTESDISCLFF